MFLRSLTLALCFVTTATLAQVTKPPATQMTVNSNAWTAIVPTSSVPNTVQSSLDWLDRNFSLLGGLTGSSWSWIFNDLGEQPNPITVQSVFDWFDSSGPYLPGTNIVDATYDADSYTWLIPFLNVAFSNWAEGNFVTKGQLDDILGLLPEGGGVVPGVTTGVEVYKHVAFPTGTYSHVETAPPAPAVLTVHMWGASGGGGGFAGPGGYAKGEIHVVATPTNAYQIQTGSVYYIEVGTAGGTGQSSPIGFGGRGLIGSWQSGGGGRSALRTDATDAATELLVAGGGGGAGSFYKTEYSVGVSVLPPDVVRSAAGSGGGSSGQSAASAAGITTGIAGSHAGGGTQGAAGSGGAGPTQAGNNGARVTGGVQGLFTVSGYGAIYGGGGGGGYYGGGGGGFDGSRAGAAGGGSGYIGGALNGTTSQSPGSQMSLTGRGPSGTAVLQYTGSAGTSGSMAGNHGLVVIITEETP